MNCTQPGCSGEITDGYCNICGMAPRPQAAGATSGGAASGSPAASRAAGSLTTQVGGAGPRLSPSGGRLPLAQGEAAVAGLAPGWWRCHRFRTAIP